MRRIAFVHLLLAAGLVLVIGPRPATADPSPDVTAVALGDPIWAPADPHVVSERIITPEAGIGKLFQFLQELLPPPDHEFELPFGIIPGAPHEGPYDRELRDGVKDLKISDDDTFTEGDFSGVNAVIFMLMLVPDPGAIGSSADFEEGPIIPDALLPLDGSVTVWRNNVQVEDNPIAVPPIKEFGEDFEGLDGHSHVPFFFIDNVSFIGEEIPAHGDWEYRMTLTDSGGNGWIISAFFTVDEE